MGLHLGEVELRGEHYFGPPLYRCARLMAIAHGGQIVLSGAVADLIEDALPEGVQLQDLGEHQLRDLSRPERIFQLPHPELPASFPPLRTLKATPTTSRCSDHAGRARGGDRHRRTSACCARTCACSP